MVILTALYIIDKVYMYSQGGNSVYKKTIFCLALVLFILFFMEDLFYIFQQNFELNNITNVKMNIKRYFSFSVDVISYLCLVAIVFKVKAMYQDVLIALRLY